MVSPIGEPFAAMPMGRMDRAEFFEKLAALDTERLKKALWNLYWRGSSSMRARIEAELDPDQAQRRSRPPAEAVDPEWVLSEVSDFVALARLGAYLGGDRRVSPRERSRWRFTFQRLVKDAEHAARADALGGGATALEQLVDLACELRGYDYFRSEDPVEAARFVVSDAATLLWSGIRDQSGFAEFAERAAPQFVRWESRFGWTRTGGGRLREKETSLASVLARMLPAPDMWAQFTDRYLDALDQVAPRAEPTPKGARQRAGWNREDRTAALAEWHLLLIDKLVGSEAEDRLDRLSRHPALAGPELRFFEAELADRRGDDATARTLVYEALEKLPGHRRFIDFAVRIGAPLPPRSQQIVKERER